MSELRAPDPTLTALDDELTLAVIHRGGPPAVAHRIEYERGVGYFAACDVEDPDEYLAVASGDARWFAVPCRECFPDAPKPGERACTCLLGPAISRGVLHYHPDSDLAWQVSP